MNTRIALFLFLVALPLSGRQESAARRHERCVDHLKGVARELSERSLTDVTGLEDWRRKRPELLRQVLYMLGLDPLPERTPLRAVITGTLDRPDYRIEKLVFQSRPGLYVTGNFYLPKKAVAPLPAVLYVCGHAPHPRGAKTQYQDRAAWFAERGTACLILDTLEFAEVAGPHHGLHDLNAFSWLSRGYTPAGVEVWNAIRAVDYLESRPEIDKTRVGMTGISGGGSTTWFTAAVDERIAAAAPVCSTYTFGSQARHWVAAGQCDCIYFYNTFLVDFPLVAALIAPRPLLICSGRRDGDFPPDGYHEVYLRAKKIFDLHEAGERIKEVDDDVGHSDIPLFRMESRRWMNVWLKAGMGAIDVEPLPKEPRETPDDLACLASLPADALNYRIQDLFVASPRMSAPATPEAWAARRAEVVKELGDKVFRWFPREAVPFATKVGRDGGGWAARYADYKEVDIDSERGVPIRARLLKPRGTSKDTPLLIYVKRPGDSIYALDHDELLPLLGRYTVLILMPRLTEHPLTSREYADVERSASWIGRTVASMRVWDILRAVEWVVAEEKVAASSISVYGKGETGVLGLYAGLLDPRIDRVLLHDPPGSHADGPALLNVLRITDLPEVAGLFAPRQLTFVGKIPAAYAASGESYRLLGKPDHLNAAGSLPEALEIWKY